MGVACSNSRGRPGPDSEVLPPREITDFHFLYAKNCAACHGPEGKDGAAIPLGDPVFLAIADDAVDSPHRHKRSTGHPDACLRTRARAECSPTNRSIHRHRNPLLGEARSRRATRACLPMSREAPGDPTRGAEVYATYCSSCHGPDGRGGQKASSIVDGSYLALVSDQQLRTIVIVGRPELGAPDWRDNVPGQPMSAQEISDVVAWLAAQRPQFPGTSHTRTLPRSAPRGNFHELRDNSRVQTRGCSSRSDCSSTASSVRFWRCRSCVTSCRPWRAGGAGDIWTGCHWADSSSFQPARPAWPRTAIPSRIAWDGETADIPCWVRNVDGQNFQVFAINCAHLGCPVRWFPQSNLFMCPCHGGVYYQDGSHASGPPPRGLFQYSYKVEDGKLFIKAGETPTTGSPTAPLTAEKDRHAPDRQSRLAGSTRACSLASQSAKQPSTRSRETAQAGSMSSAALR